MRKAEQRLWDTFKRRNAAGPKLWAVRMECVANDGLPDVMIEAGAAWVELKAPERPARPTTALLSKYGLNAAQISWHIKASTHSVRAYILVRDNTGALFLINGSLAPVINAMPLKRFAEFSMADNWDDIFKEIS